MRIWWLQGPPKGTPDPRNGSNASPGMCPDLFHPCSTLFHQFGATRLAYGPKRPFLAVLDPVWPYNWPKWLEQEWSLVEQVNPYQNEAENIMGCHGKPTSKNPLHTNTLWEIMMLKMKKSARATKSSEMAVKMVI